MIFIFDWGHQTIYEVGPLSKKDLPFAVEGEMYWLAKRRKWFRAFFIPTVPTETDYVLMDDESDAVFPVEKEFFERYFPLAELNKLIMENKISDEEYAKRRSNLGF